jgi:hypothetical protein
MVLFVSKMFKNFLHFELSREKKKHPNSCEFKER